MSEQRTLLGIKKLFHYNKGVNSLRGTQSFKHLIIELQHETNTGESSGKHRFIIREISIHISQ